MRKAILTLVLLGALALGAQSPTPLDYPQPEYMNPIYDSFSRNYLSTAALGRGNTGAATLGNLDNVLLNPAGYLPEKASLHIEALIKPPVARDYYQEGTLYASPVPFGSAGVGGRLGTDFSGALVYSLPKNIRVEDFHVPMNQGGQPEIWYPSYYLHQLTANLAWHRGNLHAGLNLHGQFYYLNDVPVSGTFARLRQTKFFLRPQLGLLYQAGDLGAALTFTPPQDASWDFTYAEYDTQLPLHALLAGSYAFGDNRVLAEADYENTAAIDPAFADRLTLKLGAERTVRKFTYRAGLIHSPEVWRGVYRLPVDTYDPPSGDTLWWNPIPQTGTVAENSQLLLTGGFTWRHQDININLGAMFDISGNTKVAQLGGSIDLYFSAFKKKGFLYFE